MTKSFSCLVFLLLLANTVHCQTQNDTIFNYKSESPITVDGQANEACWEQANWHKIDQVWIPYNANMDKGDFEGRFKVSWDENCLYVLVEVVDDSLSDDHSNPLSNWWNDDCLEVFVDENRSKGDHERNCNAFAYHVSLSYDAIDLNSFGQGVNYKNNIEVDLDSISENTYLWEFAIKNYNASFSINNPEASRVMLKHNKKMGFTIAYCDNDETSARENFIGSMYMKGTEANDMYKNADHFGLMVLIDPAKTTSSVIMQQHQGIRIYPVPAKNHLYIETNSLYKSITSVSISNLSGQIVKKYFFNGTSYTINIADIETGLYLVSIVQGDKHYSKRIIKR